jgi:hypothetical protein
MTTHRQGLPLPCDTHWDRTIPGTFVKELTLQALKGIPGNGVGIQRHTVMKLNDMFRTILWKIRLWWWR